MDRVKTSPVKRALIKTQEAAKLLGISQPTLNRWIAYGRCPVPFYRHPTGKTVFDSADISAYLETIKMEVNGK